MRRPTPSDLASIPAGMIPTDAARDVLEIASCDISRSIQKLIETADISPQYRAGLESALSRAEAKAAAIIDAALAPKPDA